MPDLCLVVPCFNEEHRLRTGDFLAFLEQHQGAAVCFVDDGSSDGTLALLRTVQRSCPERIHVVAVSPNGGKAEAVRAGIRQMAARGDAAILGYWDADLSTPLDEVDRLRATLDAQPSCRIALASRVKRLGADIERRLLRHVFGRVFATAASTLLGVATYDSQCGAKLFRATVVPVLFDAPFVSRWLFDVELLIRLRNRQGHLDENVAVEVPIGCWREVGGSKLKASDMLLVPLELWKIRRAYRRPPSA